MKNNKVNLKLLSHTGEPEKVIAMAGKLCYSRSNIDGLEQNLTPENIESFVNRLVSYGHESPLEHVSFTFAVEGISRACSHQLVRHRIASYSQQSQRYVDLDKVFDYVTPNIIDCMDERYNTNEYSKEFEKDMEMIHCMYTKWQKVFKTFVEVADYPTNGMTPQKIANENARAVLPNACETKLVFTMNLRTLINFVRHRKCNRAQEEIREVAILIEQTINEKFPILGKILGAPCEFGSCPEGSMNCRNPYKKRG